MNDFIYKLLVSNAGWESVTLRVPIGIILAAHGSQKLFGWFGGHGLEGTGQWMASVGLLTRPAATISAITRLVALLWVHLGNGFFLDTHGIEYALALLSATPTLILIVGGRYSLDNYLTKANFLEVKDEQTNTATCNGYYRTKYF